jgi:hypothetical protein
VLARQKILLPTLVAASLLAAAPRRASAQVVNVQPLLAKGHGTRGLTLQMDGTVDYRVGNVELLQISGKIVTQYRWRRHLVFVLGQGELGVNPKGTFLNRLLGHVRYRLTLMRALDAEVFVQADRDVFRRVALRALAGGGLRLRVINADHARLALGLSAMAEYEELRSDDKPDAGVASTVARLSAYLTVAVPLGPRLALQETVYVQPRAGNPGDVRILEELELLTRPTNILTIRLAAMLAYDAVPPIGVETFDARLQSSIGVVF